MNGLIRSPPEQPPLSNRNAYTTWPGGVDPTVPLYNTDNQKFGGARRQTRRNRKAKRSNKNNKKARGASTRRSSRKSRRTSHKPRRSSRKSHRSSRKSRRASRRHRGGYATCSPIDTLGSRATIPMSASVCPEGYFQDKGLIA